MASKYIGYNSTFAKGAEDGEFLFLLVEQGPLSCFDSAICENLFFRINCSLTKNQFIICLTLDELDSFENRSKFS